MATDPQCAACKGTPQEGGCEFCPGICVEAAHVGTDRSVRAPDIAPRFLTDCDPGDESDQE